MTRKSIGIVTSLMLGIILGSAFSWHPSFADQKAEQATVGRYHAAAWGSNPGNGIIVVVDTASGQCWKQDLVRGGWEDAGSPAKAKK